MIKRNWKRAAVGACTATALVVGAGLAFAPAANAAPAANPTSTGTTGLVGGLTTGLTGVVSGLLGGTTTPTTTPTSPITVGTSSNGLTVGVGSTTVGVTTGNGVGVTVGTGNGSGVAVQLGGTVSGATGTVTVTNGQTTTTTTDPGTTTDTTGTSGGTTGTTTTTTQPASLTGISVTSQYQTVYPAKDGYRDTNTFQLNGTTSDGQQHYTSGTATLTFGSTTVATWPITATNQAIAWNGLKGGKLVPGSYTLTAVIADADGHQISGSDRVAVSAKKLATATTLLTTKSVSGTHKMAAKPLAGLSKGKVYLKVTSTKVKGVKGKQYLVFSHAGKKLKVRIKNGTHTSKYVSIPKSFTTYKISHTWKKGAVKVGSFKYHYKYKALK